MSQFSTTAHHETPQLRHVSRKWIEIAVAIIVLGAALVFVISQSDTTADQTDAPVAAATGLAAEDFVRLNTTDLEYLSPAISNSPGTVPAVATDPFEYANVESYDWLNRVLEERQAVGSHLMEMNVESYDWLIEGKVGSTTESTLQPSGPR